MDKKENIKITGMTCAACSARVERVLKKMDGIKEISVNLATEKAVIEFNSDKLSLNDVIVAIEKAGYGAEKIEKNSSDREKDAIEKDIKNLKKNLIISAILTIPLF